MIYAVLLLTMKVIPSNETVLLINSKAKSSTSRVHGESGQVMLKHFISSLTSAVKLIVPMQSSIVDSSGQFAVSSAACNSVKLEMHPMLGRDDGSLDGDVLGSKLGTIDGSDEGSELG